MTSSNNQLKNLKYQTMLIQGKLIADVENEADMNTISAALNNEKDNKQLTSWNKLSKSDKLLLLNNYVSNVLSKEYELDEKETLELKEYLQSSINRKKLHRNKDVSLDSNCSHVSKINGLLFNKQTRKFTLKDNDRKQSTLKKLAPTKSMLIERKQSSTQIGKQ